MSFLTSFKHIGSLKTDQVAGGEQRAGNDARVAKTPFRRLMSGLLGMVRVR